MWQYVDANQLSPRLSFTYKPFEYTTFHAGYARYFTPPVLVEAAPANIALFNNTTGAPTNRREQSGAAGALALFRRRRRPEDSVRMQHAGGERLHRLSISGSTFTTNLRPTSSTTAISDRRWC